MIRKRIRLWLSETHGPQFELLRHFLPEQLANDLMSSDQVRRLVIAVLAGLGCVGPLVIRLYIGKYRYLQDLDTGDLYRAAVRADRLFFISLSMIVAGLVTVVQWQSLFPTRRDYLALKPLPVRLYQIFAARFLASFLITAVVITDLNLAPSVLFPFLTSGRWQSFELRYVVAHAVATFSAGLFVFFALGAMQGILMNLLPPRPFDRLSVWIQALFATAFIAAAPCVFDIPNWHEMIAAKPRWMLLFPPAWFLGLYEAALGSRDSYFLQLCQRALTVTGVVLLLALVTYFLSYRRHANRVLEQALSRPGGRASVGRAASALMESCIKNSPSRAVFAFGIQTLRRSRPHKLVMGFCLSIAFVLALQTAGPSMVTHLRSGESWSVWQQESILSIPLVMSAVVISALCYVFKLPAEPRASWIFRLAAESSDPRMLLDSVEYLLFCGLASVLLIALPIEVFALGGGLAFAHIAMVAVLMLLLMEARLYEWHKIPFTCSYLPGRRNIWQIMAVYLGLFVVLIPVITSFEARLLRPFFLLAIAGALSFLYFSLRSRRRAQWRIVPLLFDESDEPLIATLRLNRE
jgi:hypothetical protein